jgi:hypothetical protein
MAFGFAYSDRASVDALRRYYDALWELATPVVENGQVIESQYEAIRAWNPGVADDDT